MDGGMDAWASKQGRLEGRLRAQTRHFLQSFFPTFNLTSMFMFCLIFFLSSAPVLTYGAEHTDSTSWLANKDFFSWRLLFAPSFVSLSHLLLFSTMSFVGALRTRWAWLWLLAPGYACLARACLFFSFPFLWSLPGLFLMWLLHHFPFFYPRTFSLFCLPLPSIPACLVESGSECG
ncbi:hypothetical protein BDY21DRAFT_346852 [Lineolata rhizophorae]|uniref:Uncharacterized protein n=1 Tax=Lineolata rhizophorae TaxID=578093 RepID=A0A6A6NX86_9PEZI|nr:hypothetical protein BDY21DRAFT_346852 [Lineolata rhizophorae]